MYSSIWHDLSNFFCTMLINCCKHFNLLQNNCMRCKPNKDLTSTAVSLFLLNILQLERKFALLKGPGNKSKCRLSLLTNFAYGGCREEKTCCEFEQNLMLKQKIYLTFNERKPIAQCNICFSRQKTQCIFSINTRHNKSADFFFRSIFPPKDFRVYFSIKTRYNMKT